MKVLKGVITQGYANDQKLRNLTRFNCMLFKNLNQFHQDTTTLIFISSYITPHRLWMPQNKNYIQFTFDL